MQQIQTITSASVQYTHFPVQTASAIPVPPYLDLRLLFTLTASYLASLNCFVTKLLTANSRWASICDFAAHTTSQILHFSSQTHITAFQSSQFCTFMIGFLSSFLACFLRLPGFNAFLKYLFCRSWRLRCLLQQPLTPFRLDCPKPAVVSIGF